MNKLTNLLSVARTKVKVGSLYYHYRSPDKHYKVLTLAIREETEQVSVIYKSQQEDGLVWDRNFDVWNSQVEHEGRKMSRFIEVDLCPSIRIMTTQKT